jgi:hypothetical protein
LDEIDVFHRYRVTAVGILSDRFRLTVEVHSMPNPNALPGNRFADHVFQSIVASKVRLTLAGKSRPQSEAIRSLTKLDR